MNYLKALFRPEPFNRALYSMSAPGQPQDLTFGVGC